MKKLFLIIFAFAAFTCVSCFCCISVSAASSPDEAVISQNSDNFTPLETKPAQSASSSGVFSVDSSVGYELFYTQTTFLALIAGYLIIFKLRCFKNSPRRRKRLDSKQ